eukprot:CAMPEP_0169167786 /NCGR_PEP_ID=MMETSP1015-20121227/60657_1 /TAXON_ID=342587 /ORGANISM="Karlodinium micrum, Strain CCMP2283" /LENGTH=543 /DNA_ID=CAMNT_0009240519 /DNA_START=78 /DNA_END=1709 /DNA_ORIENTATION=+
MATTVICLILVSAASASEFLKGAPKEMHESLSEAEIRTSLLEEIESTLGAGSASGRLAQLEASLQPIFTALQKNEHGNLGHATVRYALHRLFVLRHGWNIKGLGANGGQWNSSSPIGVLKDQVPEYIEQMFEKRLGGRGFGLRELAVLGATIEHLIHKETVSKLGDAFNVLNYLPTSNLSQEEGDQVLDTYMMAYILGENLANLTYEGVIELNAEMPELFLAWRDTQQFVRDIGKRLAREGETTLDFASLANTAEVVGEEFGTFQDAECGTLKKNLMDLEDRQTGRVKLSEFYKPAMSGAWQFQESVGYLRQLGALDESGATPSVIITNYLYSQANCIASSGYYAVCCKDECEGLLGNLEEKFAAPEATASAIASMVEYLPSSTVEAPRELSPSLRKRLDDIALLHGGQVPLHGRLFAQWMHHAYPHECPYPHISGTTSQQSSDEWATESGIESTATEEEMAQFTNVTEIQDQEEQEEIAPWSHEEELLVSRPSTVLRADLSAAPPMLRSAMLILAAVSLAFGMVQSFKGTLSTNDDNVKFVV